MLAQGSFLLPSPPPPVPEGLDLLNMAASERSLLTQTQVIASSAAAKKQQKMINGEIQRQTDRLANHREPKSRIMSLYASSVLCSIAHAPPGVSGALLLAPPDAVEVKPELLGEDTADIPATEAEFMARSQATEMLKLVRKARKDALKESGVKVYANKNSKFDDLDASSYSAGLVGAIPLMLENPVRRVRMYIAALVVALASYAPNRRPLIELMADGSNGKIDENSKSKQTKARAQAKKDLDQMLRCGYYSHEDPEGNAAGNDNNADAKSLEAARAAAVTTTMDDDDNARKNNTKTGPRLEWDADVKTNRGKRRDKGKVDKKKDKKKLEREEKLQKEKDTGPVGFILGDACSPVMAALLDQLAIEVSQWQALHLVEAKALATIGQVDPKEVKNRPKTRVAGESAMKHLHQLYAAAIMHLCIGPSPAKSDGGEEAAERNHDGDGLSTTLPLSDFSRTGGNLDSELLPDTAAMENSLMNKLEQSSGISAQVPCINATRLSALVSLITPAVTERKSRKVVEAAPEEEDAEGNEEEGTSEGGNDDGIAAAASGDAAKAAGASSDTAVVAVSAVDEADGKESEQSKHHQVKMKKKAAKAKNKKNRKVSLDFTVPEDTPPEPPLPTHTIRFVAVGLWALARVGRYRREVARLGAAGRLLGWGSIVLWRETRERKFALLAARALNMELYMVKETAMALDLDSEHDAVHKRPPDGHPHTKNETQARMADELLQYITGAVWMLGYERKAQLQLAFDGGVELLLAVVVLCGGDDASVDTVDSVDDRHARRTGSIVSDDSSTNSDWALNKDRNTKDRHKHEFGDRLRHEPHSEMWWWSHVRHASSKCNALSALWTLSHHYAPIRFSLVSRHDILDILRKKSIQNELPSRFRLLAARFLRMLLQDPEVNSNKSCDSAVRAVRRAKSEQSVECSMVMLVACEDVEAQVSR